ncbi:MAG: hypothetical protein R3B98_05645 [Hyphomonas sp.]
MIEVSLMVKAIKAGPGPRIVSKGGGGADLAPDAAPAVPHTIRFDV